MTYKILPARISCDDDGCALVIGFSEAEEINPKYVLVQRQHEFDEQDRRLQMDRVHIEIEDQSRSVYGGLVAVGVDDRQITLALSEEAQKALRIDGAVEIVLEEHLNPGSIAEVYRCLQVISAAEGVSFVSSRK